MARAEAEQTQSHPNWILLATILASGMVFLDGTVVNVAIRRIGEELPATLLGTLEAQAYITSGYLAVLAALLILGGALADKYGRLLIMRIGLWVYLAGCIFGFFIRDIRWTFLFLPIFGLGGSIVLTLPYAILMKLMPKENIGQFTGMFSMTRGLANIIAPLVAGVAIDVAGKFMASGREYAVIWLVSALMIAISLFFFRNTDSHEVLNV